MGKREASVTGKALAGIRFDRIFSSDMKRASETAEIIAKANEYFPSAGKSVERNKLFRERHVGDLEGKTYAEYFAFAANEGKHHILADPRNGETLSEVKKRAAKIIEYLIDHGESEQILLVAHGAILTYIGIVLDEKFGCEISQLRGDLKNYRTPKNCSITELTFDKSVRKFTLDRWASHDHL